MEAKFQNTVDSVQVVGERLCDTCVGCVGGRVQLFVIIREVVAFEDEDPQPV